MRAAAQVDEFALLIQRQDLVGRNVLDDAGLVLLTPRAEKGHRLVARHFAALHLQIVGDDLLHLVLDRLQIFGAKRLVAGKIVVEAIVDRRTDRDLGAREQALYRLRHQVCSRMTDDFHAFLVARGDDAQASIPVDPVAGIDHSSIKFTGQRRLGEARADRGCHLRYRDRLLELSLTAIGQRNLNHECGPESGRTNSGILPETRLSWPIATQGHGIFVPGRP